MANTPSAKKRAKQAEKRRSHNASLRSMVRTYIKNVVKAIDAKDAEKAQAAYVLAVPVIDRMADKGIIHKNKAARHKSRLNGHVKALNLAVGRPSSGTHACPRPSRSPGFSTDIHTRHNPARPSTRGSARQPVCLQGP